MKRPILLCPRPQGRKTNKAEDVAYDEAQAAKAEAKLVANSASAIAAVEAVVNAEVAELELAQLPAETPQSVRRAKIGEVQRLEMTANEKARWSASLRCHSPDVPRGRPADDQDAPGPLVPRRGRIVPTVYTWWYSTKQKEKRSGRL